MKNGQSFFNTDKFDIKFLWFVEENYEVLKKK